MRAVLTAAWLALGAIPFAVFAGEWSAFGAGNGEGVVATHPTTGGRAMIVTGSDGLFAFITQDGGAHWIGSPRAASHYGPVHLSGSIAWMDGDRTLLRSADQGRSWGPIQAPWVDTHPVIAGVNPADPDELVVLQEPGIHHTQTGGKFWRAEYPPATLVSATVDWSTRRVYAVASDGAIWRHPVDATGGWEATPANARAVGAGHGIVLYASVAPAFTIPPVKGSLFRSTDHGATFAKVAETYADFEHFSDVAFSTSPSRVYATDTRRLLRSDDAGATWTAGAFALGLESLSASVAVDAGNPDKVYVTTALGILVSTDAGATLTGLDHASGAPGRSRSIAVDATDPSRQWLVAPHLVTPETMLERSTDAGATWSVLPFLDGYPIAASRQRTNTVFGASAQGFEVSTDGGATWVTTFRPFTDRSFYFQALAQGGIPPVVVLAGERDQGSGLWISNDDGATFAQRASPPIVIRALAVAPSTSSTIYAGGFTSEFPGELIWRSLDGGVSWLPVGNFPPRILGWTSNDAFALAVDPRDAARVYAGFVYPDNLMRSDDAGVSWTRVTTGLGAGAVTAIALDPANPDTVYAAVYLSGVFRSTNRGATWTALDAGLRDDTVRQLLFDPHRPGRLYAATQSGTYKVDLAGGLPAGRRRAIEFHHSAFNHYFVSADQDEITGLDDGVFQGWLRTNQGFRVAEPQETGNLPTCRFFGVGFGLLSSHFYTQYPAECEGLKSNPAWFYEKIAFGLTLPDPPTHGCLPGTRPLFRAWNRNAGGAPNHRYTTDPLTLDAMIAFGWQFEGDAPTRVFACVPVE